jgi:hypothetical protein
MRFLTTFQNDGELFALDYKGLGWKKVGTFTITFKGKKRGQNEKEKEQVASPFEQLLMKTVEGHRSLLLEMNSRRLSPNNL